MNEKQRNHECKFKNKIRSSVALWDDWWLVCDRGVVALCRVKIEEIWGLDWELLDFGNDENLMTELNDRASSFAIIFQVSAFLPGPIISKIWPSHNRQH